MEALSCLAGMKSLAAGLWQKSCDLRGHAYYEEKFVYQGPVVQKAISSNTGLMF